jgi:squalene-associated FAD-dependent desaturase
MNAGTVYIVGAGLAGLSAAVTLAAQGVGVKILESAPTAGGRCRSYYEPVLGRMIDNGNHLILSGNCAVQDYVRMIGSSSAFVGPKHAEFAFADLGTGAQWTIRPNDGFLPWWIVSKRRRVPDTRLSDYLALRSLLRGHDGPLGDVPRGALWDRLLQPILLAALNTKPERATARLVAAVMRETLAKGGRAYRPRIASPTLAAALVDPAISFVQARNGTFQFSQRLRNIVFGAANVQILETGDQVLQMADDDRVILAVPPWVAASVIPGISTPDEFRAIVSGHFAVAPPLGTPAMTGLIGGTVEWIFAFPDRISVTISNADRWVDMDRAKLAALCWADVSQVLRLPRDLPAWQIVKEKRATFAAIPEQESKRPNCATAWKNLFLAGDWTNTGLPATIEGAVRSGNRAAQLALASMLV